MAVIVVVTKDVNKGKGNTESKYMLSGIRLANRPSQLIFAK
jgi:hypothetical protein